jgi:hypothetical protein
MVARIPQESSKYNLNIYVTREKKAWNKTFREATEQLANTMRE